MILKLLAPLFILLSMPVMANTPNNANQATTIENSGDGFTLLEESYEDNESFVFTSVANFENGQACGLVFGAEENSHYWVFNVDRYENSTKLMYFTVEEERATARELYREYFIGNDKITQSELNVINPNLGNNPRFDFKIVITIEDEHAYAEFFIDNIKRFGVDKQIDLNNIPDFDKTYTGGTLGYNVFNGKVNFTDATIGKSDYSYYTELYRNQYHYSQYSHWNNDPNGLVYYNGWYHLYYQLNPFSQLWGDMYWGHARSRDLIHWQELPIALFPDDGNMGVGLGKGFAWSGIAMVYHQGMSDLIDSLGWFPSGEGLLGYYTRDGERQDQVIITSDDEGFTWTKRSLISQHLCVDGRKVDCRDPSIFPLVKSGNKVTKWGMALSGGNENKIWFLKSDDMVNWQLAGDIEYTWPECVTLAKVKTSDNEEHYAMSVSSRRYIIGDISYNTTSGEVDFILANGTNLTTYEGRTDNLFKRMDYGLDSYAGQCFYIDDTSSEYYGESVMISWNFGTPQEGETGEYAQVRDPWNGGMTMPVKLGINKTGNDYVLTQTPITINNEKLSKKGIININNVDFDGNTNPLSSVNTHIFELDAKITNPNKEDVEFLVNVSSDEETSFGWTKEEGYFFDRTETSDGGIDFKKQYHHRFITGPVDQEELTFYVLCDNGTLELYLGNFEYTFYNATLAAPYSIGADLRVSGEVKINKLEVNSIDSIWKDLSSLEEGVLHLDTDHIDLDLTLGASKEVMAFSTNGDSITWEITSGEEVISLEKTTKGATITALKNGEAEIKVCANNTEKTITVTVDDADVNCFFEPKKENIHSGEWLTTSKGLVGYQKRGDGFIFSTDLMKDGTYTTSFDLTNADAAGILLRASKDLSSFIMCNYDKVIGACKVWSNNGEIARQSFNVENLSSVALSVDIDGDQLKLGVNGNELINVTLAESEPKTGYCGLNVCSGKVTFKQTTLLKEEYDFVNDDLLIINSTSQHIEAIYNVTDKNTLVSKEYYTVTNEGILLSKEYFSLLNENTTYTFYIQGSLSSFVINVNVTTIDETITFNDIEVQLGVDVNVYVGNLEIYKVTVNGVEVKYTVNDHVLTICNCNFAKEGDYEVSINDEHTFLVTVNAPSYYNPPKENNNNGLVIGLVSGGASLLVIAGVIVTIFLIKKKRGSKHD